MIDPTTMIDTMIIIGNNINEGSSITPKNTQKNIQKNTIQIPTQIIVTRMLSLSMKMMLSIRFLLTTKQNHFKVKVGWIEQSTWRTYHPQNTMI